MAGDPQFESWSVSDSPITIDYSLVVLEEIRHEVNQGLQKFSRGGVDVGGVLYGSRDGRKIRVSAVRMIPCSHLHGPSFILSEEDQAGLTRQLSEDASDPHLQGLICLGWFLSHNRGEMALTEADVQLYSQFFHDPWQVTLVIRPGRAGSMKAAFFVREPDGTVRADLSYKEFNLPDRLAAVPLPGNRERAGSEGRATFRSLPPIAVPSRAEPRSSGTLMPAFDASQYVPMPAPAENRKWPWVASGAVVAAVLAAFAWNYLDSAPALPPSLGLVMIEREGQLQVEWNPTAAPVMLAAGGELNISDGGEAQAVPLAPRDLASGKFVYVRKTGDVEVRMKVMDAAGRQVEEASRFLGRPPEAPKNDELDALQARSRQLEAEIARLRGENERQAQRIQELERIRLILQSRLGIP
jgi:hypothetical protein